MENAPVCITDSQMVPANLTGVMEAWLIQVERRTGSMKTVESYKSNVTRFLAVVGDPASATPAHVHAYCYGDGGGEGWRFRATPSSSTVGVRLAALRSFYDFGRRMGGLTNDPTRDVRGPRRSVALPKGLSNDEVKQLFAVVPSSPSGLRDRAMIGLGLTMGLRRAEILGITAGDFSRNGSIYLSWRGKGGKQRRRQVPLAVFNAILASLAKIGKDLETMAPDEKVFNISSSGLYANFMKYAKKAGISDFSPHVLRHTAAKLRRANGASIEEVSNLLGHTDIATTARYLKRLEGEDDPGVDTIAAMIGF